MTAAGGLCSSAVKSHWWVWYVPCVPHSTLDTLKDECVCRASLFIKLAPCMRAKFVHITEVINHVILTQWCDCSASLEKKGGKKINRVGVEGRENKNSGQQHPRSLVGRQTLMLKFSSHSRLQTMLLTREGKDERQREREKRGEHTAYRGRG